MKRRWKPKQWLRPGSRRWREAQFPDPGHELIADVLKELWPQSDGPVLARPAWATLAHKRGWMTSREYYALKREPTGQRRRGLSSLAYEASPFLRMLKKDVAFG